MYTVDADVPLDSVLVCFCGPLSVSDSVVLHRCRRYVTVESSARHTAAVDLRSWCDEKTWTTVRRTMSVLKEVVRKMIERLQADRAAVE